MASVPSVTAFFGLLVSMYATGFFAYVDLQSGAKSCVVRAPPLDAAVHTMLLAAAAAAMVAFNTAVALIYARLGGGGGAVDRRIPQVVYLTLFASSGVLHVFLVPQRGAIDGGQDLLPLAAVAVVHVLRPAAAAATFFLSMTLIYAHVRAGGGGEGGAGAAAGNVPIPTTAVELLTKLVLAAALVTVVLTLTATVLASYAD